jgi:DDE superfamily endonuclease
VRRALRRLGASFRRARRVPAKRHNERREASFEKALEKARLLAECGAIDVMHGDESGFCLVPPLPYLWQMKGQTVGLPAQAHHQRLNVLGFWREAGVEGARLIHRLVLGRLKSGHFIRAVEELVLPLLVRPTVLLVDNARLHRCARVLQKRHAWKAQGLHLWFLPPYCPHLNRIEVLWKQCKYHWLEPADYTDFPTLCAAVSHTLKQVNLKMPHYLCPIT